TTFNIIATELLKHDSPPALGMIGTGSANDIVRGLGIHRVETACKIIKTGRIRQMDIGRIHIKGKSGKTQELFFLGTVSAGLGAAVNQYVEACHQRHKRLAKFNPLTQLTAGLLGIRDSFTSDRLPVKAFVEYTDEEANQRFKMEIQFSLLVFLNTPFYANGLKLIDGSPGDRLFDGQVDCCVIHTDSFLSTMKIALKVPKGAHVNREEVTLLNSPFF
ncbi:MAG: hypothetical protein GY940_10245, partial [bacterium]|nr:hypothetical protein [bacterium]